ncbi:MAG TPA: UvrD-helicase domain-containing protein, partial [Candidatus Krumholzibacteria bacterium]|nr:UvrD-helicase domain-containing protein [Candidatus Krumholzibacteria bacterium]
MTGHDAVQASRTIQAQAASPAVSVALRASAGSGKTTVLANRFVRLCIEGEGEAAHPRAILAITFTRKAATEIRERLLDLARRLALADDAARRDALFALLGDREPQPTELDRAARLYERLLEDPAGLQIGTIHAFCQRVLARFATEAGLDPHAGLLEDPEDLVDEALDQLMTEAAADRRLGALAAELGSTPIAVRQEVRTVFKEQMRI